MGDVRRARLGRRCSRGSIHTEHFFNGADPGDGVFGVGEGHGDGTDELAVDVDGTATHTLHDAGVLEGSTGEAGEDEGFFGAGIFEDAEDFDLEVGDGIAFEDGLADAAHAGVDVAQRHDGGGWRGGEEGSEKDRGQDETGHPISVVRSSGGLWKIGFESAKRPFLGRVGFFKFQRVSEGKSQFIWVHGIYERGRWMGGGGGQVGGLVCDDHLLSASWHCRTGVAVRLGVSCCGDWELLLEILGLVFCGGVGRRKVRPGRNTAHRTSTDFGGGSRSGGKIVQT